MDDSKFISLPRELRNKVYAYLSPPTIISSIIGILQTCKQIRAEAEEEIVRNGNQFLSLLEREYSEVLSALVLIDKPSKLQDYAVMRIRLPVYGVISPDHKLITHFNLAELAPLPTKEFRIELYIDRPNLDPSIDSQYRLHCYIVSVMFYYFAEDRRRRKYDDVAGATKLVKLTADTFVFDFSSVWYAEDTAARIGRHCAKWGEFSREIEIKHTAGKEVRVVWAKRWI
ncbi:hypothetical protein P154DRAFT_539766 [Amniculicola lignicola CBS 123094]|uniref:Uncharacterized protein n=1 Tax=Amniculicola lignicola CBS 123094 TaxID=1392246 RepID=A0A6A5VXH4_9PLEO|nr:hypothetical protein P154DRAFT_539766 [Amniculicola lignicola CBS 123094]